MNNNFNDLFESLEDVQHNLTLYIASWSWQILGIMFLVASFISLIFDTFLSKIFFVAFFLVFMVCEYVSLKRKGEISNGRQ